jgi:hypothetical protein
VNEERLLKILQGGERLSSVEIVAIHFARRRRPPNAQRSVTTVLNSLILKTRKNGEKFRICKSRRDGPRSIEWWSAAL